MQDQILSELFGIIQRGFIDSYQIGNEFLVVERPCTRSYSNRTSAHPERCSGNQPGIDHLTCGQQFWRPSIFFYVPDKTPCDQRMPERGQDYKNIETIGYPSHLTLRVSQAMAWPVSFSSVLLPQ
jgi:hypothetical protein